MHPLGTVQICTGKQKARQIIVMMNHDVFNIYCYLGATGIPNSERNKPFVV